MKLRDFNKKLQKSAKFNIPNQSDKINFTDFIIPKEPIKKNIFIPRLLMSLSSLLLLLTLSFYLYLNFTPITTLTIDINPSIEVKLNSFNRVVNINGNTDDSNDFVEALDARNMTVDDLLESVYSQGIESGLFTEANAYALVGIYSDTYEEELSLQEMISGITNIVTLSILQHDSEQIINDYYTTNRSSTNATQSDYNDLFDNDYTAGTDASETPEVIAGSTDYTISIEPYTAYVYSNMYQISQTKLYLVIDIYNMSDNYTTEDDFNYLIDLDIQNLITLYQSLI